MRSHLPKSEETTPDLNDFFWLATRAATSEDQEELLSLAGCDSVAVRISLTANPNTPHMILAQLARDLEAAVRLALAQSSDINFELLRELALDKDEEVATAAKQTLAFIRKAHPDAPMAAFKTSPPGEMIA